MTDFDDAFKEMLTDASPLSSLESVTDVPFELMAKIERIHRCAALVSLMEFVQNTDLEDGFRLGAANCILMATMPRPLAPGLSEG